MHLSERAVGDDQHALRLRQIVALPGVAGRPDQQLLLHSAYRVLQRGQIKA